MLTIFGNKSEVEEESESGLGDFENKEDIEYNEDDYLRDEEIQEFLAEFKGGVPSFILRELENALAGRDITKLQFARIMDKVVTSYGGRYNTEKVVSGLSSKISLIESEFSDVKELTGNLNQLMGEVVDIKTELSELRGTVENLTRDLRLLFNFNMDLESYVEDVLGGHESERRD
ncbi:hypothetical protein BMS3Bbin15_00809 [archaeon BMS3Bbin15]|nr:hypothetical protein BMS3Bbin15_00809 [archaeon BMS3Bbin15]